LITATKQTKEPGKKKSWAAEKSIRLLLQTIYIGLA
jgi:hypothetical protein